MVMDVNKGYRILLPFGKHSGKHNKNAVKNMNVKYLNIFPFYHNVLICNEDEVLSSVPVEAQAIRKGKRINTRKTT